MPGERRRGVEGDDHRSRFEFPCDRRSNSPDSGIGNSQDNHVGAIKRFSSRDAIQTKPLLHQILAGRAALHVANLEPRTLKIAGQPIPHLPAGPKQSNFRNHFRTIHRPLHRRVRMPERTFHPRLPHETGSPPKLVRTGGESKGIDGCPTFAQADSGFPVELAGVDEPHAAFLNESRTRGCWWRPVQEIRIRGTKTMSEAQRPLSPYRLADPSHTIPQNGKAATF